MSAEGIWTGEVYGPFGWETRGVFIFDNGRIVGGDNRQYLMGTYSLSGNEISVSIEIIYHGTPRTLFGSSDATLSLQLVGRINGELIEGSIFRQDNPKQTLSIRLTKRAEIT